MEVFAKLMIKFTQTRVDPTRPIVLVEMVQVKGRQCSGSGDSGRGHLGGDNTGRWTSRCQ